MWKYAENINADEWHHHEVFAGLFWDDEVDGDTWEDAQLRQDALPHHKQAVKEALMRFLEGLAN